MNILYGVSGEGFGHSSRAKEIISHLEKRGHKVKIITYGQAFDVLSKRFDVQKVEGMRLVFKENKLDVLRTVKYNLAHFPKNLLHAKKFKLMMEQFKPGLCISDMEVIVPILSNIYKIPLFSVDNQHRITNAKIRVPKQYKKGFKVAKAVINRFVNRAEAFIVLSFSNLEITKKNTYIVPPVIRKEVLNLKPINGDKTLVYLTKRDNSLTKMLIKQQQEFVVYGFEIVKKSKNISYKKFGPEFLNDLAACNAVVATAGFSLISEALYLKKPYFALPLKGQFEQLLNACMLKDSGYGTFSDNPKNSEIKNFYRNLDNYRKNLEKFETDPNEVFGVIDKLISNLNQST